MSCGIIVVVRGGGGGLIMAVEGWAWLATVEVGVEVTSVLRCSWVGGRCPDADKVSQKTNN